MIGILIIATGNYHKYLLNLIESIERFYPKKFNKKYYIFSNHKLDINLSVNYECFYFPHKPFPHSTLFRFHAFETIKEKLLRETSVIHYIDADSLFVRQVPDFVFTSGVFGFEHGENIIKNSFELPYERNARSLACVKYGNERKYIMGGYWGGNANEILNIISELKQNIDYDIMNGIVAIFHDESHINKVFCNNPNYKIYNTNCVLGEIDSYQKKYAWNDIQNLELNRFNFINKNNTELLNQGDFFVIFLEKDHNKERNFSGEDQQIKLWR